MIIDDPETLAEVTAQFAAYERALVENDVPALDGFFLDSDKAVRFGAGENLFGTAELRAFRAARSPIGLGRVVERSQVTTYGRDLAITAILFKRDSLPGKVGRQMQTWVRFPEGWRVVAAHVSIIADPKGA